MHNYLTDMRCHLVDGFWASLRQSTRNGSGSGRIVWGSGGAGPGGLLYMKISRLNVEGDALVSMGYGRWLLKWKILLNSAPQAITEGFPKLSSE